jgi:hypothetical protein
MTEAEGLSPLHELSARERRTMLVTALFRTMGSVTVLVVLYYILPLDHATDAATVILLVAGSIGVVLVVWWEFRSILRSNYPGIKAAEALAVIGPLFLLLFASAYYLLERAVPASFGQRLSRTDSLYFTVTTFATVGYGDITAKTQGARIIVIFQMLADLIILGLGVRALFQAVQIRRQRQPATGDPRP